jgi:hypothetical protein
VDGIDNILNIFLNPSGTILYALGTEDSGSRRRILLTFDNTQNALSLISARVFENGETAFGDGYMQHVIKLLYIQIPEQVIQIILD